MKALPLLVLLLAVGCRTSSTQINKVHLGMAEPEVQAILGKPVARSENKDGSATLYYTLSENQMVGPMAGYSVKLVNGKVDSYGRDGVNAQPNQPGFVAPSP